MITDTRLYQDTKRNLFFISEDWRGGMPADYENVFTFTENPFREFKPVLGTNFAGTMYSYKKNFIAINYPDRPKYCRWVLFKKEEGQTLDDVMIFICELDDANSLPK